ncbi:hypothetical protein [Sinorhizobium sp. BG8]|uniref:hypothetical protein n=1 Tax=Sinorhizobium sp. BG8 TaxID=2613773 RepID=UPI00193D724D|nr:hypothetical protein [Sinorhizobium sp. BG8]QRM53859.1 hypothetical protein F3Y30_04275 [Sinorhizobium sp. BG8]
MADDKKSAKPPLGVVRPGNKASEDPMADEFDATAAAGESVSEQIEALRAEIGRLKESAGLLAEGTGHLAMSQARSLRDDAEELIVANPFAALAGAALVGYLFGLTRR